MFNHTPKDYHCPFCPLVAGIGDGYNQKKDVVYKNKFITAFVSCKWWINNSGHVMVVPNEHFENIYDIPDDILGEVYKAVKQVAIAIRTVYGCDGISTRQHNEPAGNQNVWHFHVHVFPRYTDDKLYQNHDNKRYVESNEKDVYADKLKKYFAALNLPE